MSANITTSPSSQPSSSLPSITDYCNAPQNYKYLTDYQIQRFNSLCVNMNNNSDSPTFGESIGTGITNVIKGMLSPSGLNMIAGVIGVKLAQPLARSILAANLPQFGPLTEEAAAKAAAELGAGAFSAITVSSASTCVITSLARLAVFANRLLDIAGGPVGILLLVLSIIAAIFDAWDPCDLNNPLGAKQLGLISTAFNQQFRQSVLINLESFTDQNGNTVLVNNWPLQYYSDSLLEKYDSEYMNKKVLYSAMYLTNLTYNSLGQLINNIPLVTSLPKASDFVTIGNIIATWSSDGNIVVQNTIIKYLPIIVLVFIVILAILFIM